MDIVHPVILTGGAGTRLWPASRQAYPKQFTSLLGNQSLFQQTLCRFSNEVYTAPLVMTGEEFRFIAVEQAAAVGLMDARIVVEPVGRDTAPAILAAAVMLEENADSLMLVAPSDHVITDTQAFNKAIRLGIEAARDGMLVTFGVKPNRPETGYGYLELVGDPFGATDVSQFHEKPDIESAQQMVEAGNFLWNSGLFLGRVRDFLAEFEAYAPDLVDPVRCAVSKVRYDNGFERLDAQAFEAVRAISIDYAIMEKTASICAVPLDCGWSDLGAWDALWALSDQDEVGNAVFGAVTSIDCTGSYLRSEDGGPHLVALGMNDVISVAMRDAVLIAPRSRSQDVKLAVQALRRSNISIADEYPRFHRPWGWYESLCSEDRFQVKRIMVKPGGVLSLQSHLHRSEHWIVVAGTAEVTIGAETRLVTENEGVYIPLGEKHRMANRGQVPMFLIEVQTGAYLGEDDIIRYEDVYQRT